MRTPVLAAIVGQRTAQDIPLVGTVHNLDILLGRSAIVGIKTGNTSHAGGVFIGAATLKFNARPATIVTAVMGAPTLAGAEQASLRLIRSAEANLAPVHIITAGTAVGTYQSPWAAAITARANHGLTVATWHGRPITIIVRLHAVPPGSAAGLAVGSLHVTTPQVDPRPAIKVVLAAAAAPPSVWWRLLHP